MACRPVGHTNTYYDTGFRRLDVCSLMPISALKERIKIQEALHTHGCALEWHVCPEALTKVEICCFEWGDYVYMLVMHPN